MKPGEMVNMPGKGYVNIGIPRDIIECIDMLIRHTRLGYRSRAEFVIPAIREAILEIVKSKVLRAEILRKLE